MGFLSGFIKGAAESVDTQLKDDIKRSQERAEGMAQYRITRRRAALEAQEKEKKELKNTLNNLASLVGGDIDKAAELYMAAGQNIDGGNALYTELKKNADSGIDINAALTFANKRAEPGQITDYLNKFITPISTIPLSEEEIKPVGLAGLFGGDTGDKIMRQVEAAAPLPESPTSDIEVGVAGIDRTGFLAAQEYQETLKQRERAESAEERAVSAEERAALGFQTAEERAAAAEKRAEKAEERAGKRFASDMEVREAEQARADAAEARAVADAARQAETFLTDQELKGLSIEEKQLEIEKAKSHPEFTSYERMAVYADAKLAQLESIPAEARTADDLAQIEEMTNLRDYAFEGAAVYNAKTSDKEKDTTVFSKQTRDSIINNEIKRVLQPLGLVKDIEGVMEYNIGGNELDYMDNMALAISNIRSRVAGIDDEQMNNAIAGQETALKSYAQKYIASQLDKGTKPIVEQSTDVISSNIKNGKYNAGDIIQYTDKTNVTHNFVWTGSGIL